MVAIPMRLEDALRFNGYTIDQQNAGAHDITTGGGVIHVPAMRLSGLTWRRTGAVEPSAAFYLDQLPVFDAAYAPVILSHILDRYSTRRIGYNTPDQFGLAVRRWGNLQLGPQSVINRRYISTAVALPLDTQNAATDSTAKTRAAESDFPQGQLAGDTDYASSATDRISEDHTAYTGRLDRSVASLLAEQRTTYLNVDMELLDSIEDLFLTVFDRSERDIYTPAPLSAVGFINPHNYW